MKTSNTPELPKELWSKIINFNIDLSKKDSSSEMAVMRLVSPVFKDICDSATSHTLKLTDIQSLKDLSKEKTYLKSLSVIDISNFFSKDENIQLLKQFPCLQRLSIKLCDYPYFGNESVKEIAKSCPELRHLELKRKVVPVEGQNPYLQDIELGCTFDCFKALSKLGHLEYLGLHTTFLADCQSFNEKKFTFPALTTLNLKKNSFIEADFLNYLNRFPNLQTLILDEVDPGLDNRPSWDNLETDQKYVSEAPQLKKIDIFSHYYITLHHLIHQPALYHVTSIAVAAPGPVCISDKETGEERLRTTEEIGAIFAGLLNFKKLEKLKLNMDTWSKLEENLAADHLSVFSKLPALKEFVVVNGALNQLQLLNLLNCHNLETLSFKDIMFFPKISSEKLKQFFYSSLEVPLCPNGNLKVLKMTNSRNADLIEKGLGLQRLLSVDPTLFPIDIFAKMAPNLEEIFIDLNLYNLDLSQIIRLSMLENLKSVTFGWKTSRQWTYSKDELIAKRDNLIESIEGEMCNDPSGHLTQKRLSKDFEVQYPLPKRVSI